MAIGAVDMLIPPSALTVLLGSLSGISISKLLIGGVVPGLILSVAFVADDGTIVNVEEMKPKTLESHCSTKPVRYVLEMNTGWFARKGVKAGAKLEGTPFRK